MKQEGVGAGSKGSQTKVPNPYPSSLPSCAGIEFSHGSNQAFDDQIKNEKSAVNSVLPGLSKRTLNPATAEHV